MTTERAIKQTQVSVSRVRRAIEKKLQQRVRLHRSRAREENLRLRISLLEQEIAQRQSKLEQEKLACQARDKEQADRGKELENIASELVAKRNSLVEQRRQYFQVRENLLKTSSMLALRQKELISELAFVYPIAQGRPDDFRGPGIRHPRAPDDVALPGRSLALPTNPLRDQLVGARQSRRAFLGQGSRLSSVPQRKGEDVVQLQCVPP